MVLRDTILFGKYQLCRIIGKGRTGTVFLARHISLGEYRAIKRVAKAEACYDEFRREALILKELRHPGIPIVYDLEEDETYCYLIEEFLEGESISALAERRGHLTGNMVIRYGIQICDLVHYLHSAGNEPILYLDLQPNNLLLCHETIKLVDFGCAAFLPQANEDSVRYGTPGCAAPEQYTREPLDERTDIYAIGVLLFYLATGHLPEDRDRELQADWDMVLGRGLYRIVRDCMGSRPVRPGSALEVRRRLEDLLDLKPWTPKTDSLPSLILLAVGSGPNVGVTHLALGLSACLWKWGIPNLYEECNPSGHAFFLAERGRARPDSAGICRLGRWALRPEYGPQVCLKEAAGFPVVIRDYGSDCRRARGELGRDTALQKRILCVCGGKPYDADENRSALSLFSDRPEELFLIYNFADRNWKPERPAGIPPEHCLSAPCFGDAGSPGLEAEAFFHELWNRMAEKKGGGRDRFFWLKRRWSERKEKR